MLLISSGCILSTSSKTNMERSQLLTPSLIHRFNWAWGATGAHVVQKVSGGSLFVLCVYLVGEKVLLWMWEVMWGWEKVKVAALHSLRVNVLSDQFTDEVLPCAGGSMQRQHQRFARVVAVHESIHSFEHHRWCNVLAKQSVVQVVLQTWEHRVNMLNQQDHARMVVWRSSQQEVATKVFVLVASFDLICIVHLIWCETLHICIEGCH